MCDQHIGMVLKTLQNANILNFCFPRKHFSWVVFRLSLEITKLLSQYNEGGNMAEWSARRTGNPAVPGSSPALATCWICSRSAQVQILGQACK